MHRQTAAQPPNRLNVRGKGETKEHKDHKSTPSIGRWWRNQKCPLILKADVIGWLKSEFFNSLGYEQKLRCGLNTSALTTKADMYSHRDHVCT